MKKIFFVKVCLAFLICADAQQIKVMTFNIRLNTSSDSLNAWPFRKDKLASEILFHEVQLLGVQEALHDQVQDLQDRLPQFKYIGVGRDDGKEKGEYSAIFYDTSIFTVLKSETFWLSQTPQVAGSKGWDAAITRVVTWARLKDKRSKKIFYAFNTHFDHIGQVARKESALLVLQKVKNIAGNIPVVFTGDFNSRPSDEPIRVITDLANPARLTDSKGISVVPHYGPTGTFNAFQPKERDDQPIDYIFIKNGWKVLKHATISQSWDGRFASDHFAVLAVLLL
ncbi:MAG: endonuclease/exonuclease/phosphatase family protein [Ferruginibacter sp.]